MKRKTYNNVMILARQIKKKGYDKIEAAELAVKCFDNAELYNYQYSPEDFADRIINKEQFEQEHNIISRSKGYFIS
jgi:flagella basal body P-ring formation protein FlgA